MKLRELLIENDYREFTKFLKEIEKILGGELRGYETERAFQEWQQADTSADEVAGWIEEDRTNEEHPEDDLNSFGIDGDDEDYGDYSMRQGEMGFPDRQR